MMKSIWFNLPVKNIETSRSFYRNIGFKEHDAHATNPDMIALTMGEKNVMVMLFKEAMFYDFTKSEKCDANIQAETIISMDAESIAEVDAFAETVEKAGGKIFGKPAHSQGYMYGMAFQDPDGHRWNMLYMDPEKMPKF